MATSHIKREHRTRVDWAREIKRLLDEDFPRARKVRLVCDNLNTHHIASLYEAFPAAEAHRLTRRLEITYTPRNGKLAQRRRDRTEFPSRQCLDRRIPDSQTPIYELCWLTH